jgi:hypothetical protein
VSRIPEAGSPVLSGCREKKEIEAQERMVEPLRYLCYLIISVIL